MDAAPLSLLIAHAPIADDRALAALTAAELPARLHDAARLPLPSGQDVLALLARAVPHDLGLIEVSLAGESPPPDGNPLIGTTLLVDAETVRAHALEALQQVSAGRGQQELISALVKLGRGRGELASRRALAQALQGEPLPAAATAPNALLETAAAAAAIRRAAAQAVAQQHSLILRYEAPQPARARTAGGFWRAQLRALLLADLFAVLVLLLAFFRTDLWRRDGAQILDWREPLASYGLLLAGFLLPLWLAQAVAYGQARRRGAAAVRLLPAADAAGLDPARLRPFLFSLLPRPFLLSALYLPPPGPPPAGVRPAWLYAAIAAGGALCLILLRPQPTLGPWLAQFLAAFTLSALAFGVSHLIADGPQT